MYDVLLMISAVAIAISFVAWLKLEVIPYARFIFSQKEEEEM